MTSLKYNHGKWTNLLQFTRFKIKHLSHLSIHLNMSSTIQLEENVEVKAVSLNPSQRLLLSGSKTITGNLKGEAQSYVKS